jgi:hypothetical protein
LVLYTRDRSGDLPRNATYVDSPGSHGGMAIGGIGCQAVGYPWRLSIGPANANPATFEVILDSANASGGTATVWIDVSPVGNVTYGWGRPEWATTEAASNCGE